MEKKKNHMENPPFPQKCENPSAPVSTDPKKPNNKGKVDKWTNMCIKWEKTSYLIPLAQQVTLGLENFLQTVGHKVVAS